ncbi:hypothetical protein QCA50_020879 [Cerrena zonata]|uniref:G domain-containing protein n=1 Tax=Cerrena zonata TaxID=2478898 RepID=A0AAW0F8I6_9APHY
MYPRPNRDIMIAVMGATGAGKSTFINMASGGHNTVGHELMSCTQSVTYSNCTVDGRRIVLIDTPGFDHTYVSDTDILRIIAFQLEVVYKQGITLSGILYLHRISDTPLGATYQRNFEMFCKLCGDDALKNVLIVTTMWGTSQSSIGTEREKELATNERFFKPALDKGAAMIRHDNTPGRAQDILRIIMKNHPAPLQIQRELVDERKNITETTASEVLTRSLTAMVEKQKAILDELREDLKKLAERGRDIARFEAEYCNEGMGNEEMGIFGWLFGLAGF